LLPVPFSVRWNGKVRANAGGTYQFFTLSDEGVRLWVNGSLIISNWAAHGLAEDSGSLSLAAGQFYDVVLEYYNAIGVGSIVLSWQPPGEAKQVIPASNLTAHLNNNPPILGMVTNRFAVRGGLVTFAASASDPDGHGLVYSLDAGAPIEASIHSTSGVLSWTPSGTQPFGPQQFVLRVTDTPSGGAPAMTDAQTFTVTVLTNPPLAVRLVALPPSPVVALSWPQSAGTAQLLSATNLNAPVSWLPVTNAPVLSNGEWSVALPVRTNGTEFYQLRTP
jgi:hypothetical protein